MSMKRIYQRKKEDKFSSSESPTLSDNDDDDLSLLHGRYKHIFYMHAKAIDSYVGLMLKDLFAARLQKRLNAIN